MSSIGYSSHNLSPSCLEGTRLRKGGKNQTRKFAGIRAKQGALTWFHQVHIEKGYGSTHREIDHILGCSQCSHGMLQIALHPKSLPKLDLFGWTVGLSGGLGWSEVGQSSLSSDPFRQPFPIIWLHPQSHQCSSALYFRTKWLLSRRRCCLWKHKKASLIYSSPVSFYFAAQKQVIIRVVGKGIQAKV